MWIYSYAGMNIILTWIYSHMCIILILVYSHVSITRIILNLGELGRGLVCALYTPRFHRTWDLEPVQKIPQSRYSSLYALDSSPLQLSLLLDTIRV